MTTDAATESRGIAARMGHWSARHRNRAIVGWIAFVILAAIVGGGVGTQKLSTTETLDGDSAAASRTLDHAGFRKPAIEQVLVQARSGPVLTAEGREALADVVRATQATGRVRDVRSPLASANHGQLSRDGRSAVVLLAMRGDPEHADKRVRARHRRGRAGRARPPQALRIEEFGAASANHALAKTIQRDFQRAEGISVPLTFGILLIAFGALAAALIPLALALTAVIAAGGLLAITSQALHVDDSSGTVLLLIGLAVGVDYTLFYLRRAREERARGRSSLAAVDAAAATSGRSVLVSGLTVIIAMAGMFITGQGTFMGMAEATVLVVAVAVLGSLTVLPASLALLGDRVDKGRLPWLGKRLQARREQGPSRFWTRVLEPVLAHPGRSAAIAALSLLILATPALRLHTEVLTPSEELPHSLAIMQTYERLQRAFPGDALPASVVVSAADVSSPRVTAQLSALRVRALASGRMSEPVTVEAEPANTAAIVNIPLAGNGRDAASHDALQTLRDQMVPATIGRVATAHVMGSTAISTDFNNHLKSRAPFVIAFVLALAFVLLLVELPVGRDRRDRPGAQPAVGRRVLRGPGRRVPVGLGQVDPRPVRHRCDRGMAAAVHVRDPVWALDGLPRVLGLTDQGGTRPRRADTHGHPRRHRAIRGRDHKRGDHHGVRLPDVRHAQPDLDEATRSRTGHRRPAGRHGGACHPAALDDGVARRAQLVTTRARPPGRRIRSARGPRRRRPSSAESEGVRDLVPAPSAPTGPSRGGG